MLAAVSCAAAACGSSSASNSATTTPSPIAEASSTPTTATSSSTTDTPTQAATGDELFSVEGTLNPGERFGVSFFGPLRTLRGGYLLLQTTDGEHVALLRGDGNADIPMGYDLDLNAEILDDGISGNTSTFILPPELNEGTYTLCTANSLPNGCVDVVVAAHP
jgi:hypothetical protein